VPQVHVAPPRPGFTFSTTATQLAAAAGICPACQATATTGPARHDHRSTPLSEPGRTTRAAPGRHLWGRWFWRQLSRPLRTWRRFSDFRQQAGVGGEWPGNWAARPRRCASSCGSGFWPTAAMPMSLDTQKDGRRRLDPYVACWGRGQPRTNGGATPMLFSAPRIEAKGLVAADPYSGHLGVAEVGQGAAVHWDNDLGNSQRCAGSAFQPVIDDGQGTLRGWHAEPILGNARRSHSLDSQVIRKVQPQQPQIVPGLQRFQMNQHLYSCQGAAELEV